MRSMRAWFHTTPRCHFQNLKFLPIWFTLLSMLIDVPQQIEARLTPESAALNLALGLFVSDEVTLGQAARIAKIPYAQFMKELGKRKIPIHYGVAEFEEDLTTIDRLSKK